VRFNESMAEHSTEPDYVLGSGLPRRIHLLGLGGAGVSGAARILAARGAQLSGHDRAPSDMLRALVTGDPGLTVTVGPSEASGLPADTQLVVRSAAVPADDPQVVEAERRGLPVLKYAQLLARLMPADRGLAVAGTHGKTTTTWMLWHALAAIHEELGDELGVPAPGALVGGLNPSLAGPGARLGSNAVAGDSGGLFAVEACEYDRSFLELAPFGAIVTNVEADHLDYYGDLETIEAAFMNFTDRIAFEGLCVVGSGVPGVVEHGSKALVWRLGRELRVDDQGPVEGRRRFVLSGPGWATPPVHLSVPGDYNVENAALAIGLAVGVVCRGVDRRHWPRVAAAAGRGAEAFHGAGRRFERWSGQGERPIVHDYAHHPTEVRAVLGATAEAFGGAPVHVLFQPHQHSRTARFLEDFADSLKTATRVVVAPVYGARVHIDGELHAGSTELADLTRKLQGDAIAEESLEVALARFVRGLEEAPGAIALVLGAGDIEEVRDELISALALSSTPVV